MILIVTNVKEAAGKQSIISLVSDAHLTTSFLPSIENESDFLIGVQVPGESPALHETPNLQPTNNKRNTNSEKKIFSFSS